jgi:hypothetical protein
MDFFGNDEAVTEVPPVIMAQHPSAHGDLSCASVPMSDLKAAMDSQSVANLPAACGACLQDPDNEGCGITHHEEQHAPATGSGEGPDMSKEEMEEAMPVIKECQAELDAGDVCKTIDPAACMENHTGDDHDQQCQKCKTRLSPCVQQKMSAIHAPAPGSGGGAPLTLLMAMKEDPEDGPDTGKGSTRQPVANEGSDSTPIDMGSVQGNPDGPDNASTSTDSTVTNQGTPPQVMMIQHPAGSGEHHPVDESCSHVPMAALLDANRRQSVDKLPAACGACLINEHNDGCGIHDHGPCAPVCGPECNTPEDEFDKTKNCKKCGECYSSHVHMDMAFVGFLRNPHITVAAPPAMERPSY